MPYHSTSSVKQFESGQLKIAVIGAGVGGLTTAWELASDGHDVSVFEQTGSIAEGASFASNGWLGWHGLTEWPVSSPEWPKAGPGGISASAEWWFKPGARRWLSLRRKHVSPDTLEPLRTARITLASLGLQRFEKSLLHGTTTLERTRGMMLLMRTPADEEVYKPGIHRLKQDGVPILALDAAARKKLEPGLSDDIAPAASWSLSNDEIINGRQWLIDLKATASRMGCQFLTHTTVSHIKAGGILCTQSDKSGDKTQTFDAIVICTGYDAAKLLLRHGWALPLLNMSQCSVSAPISEPMLGPVSGVFDVNSRITISRTGMRLKASSSDGLWPGEDPKPSFRKLYQAMIDWFPGATHLHGLQACTQNWQGICSHTPDGLPLVGRSPLPGVWINMGHGSSGWTFAPGAARYLADLMEGRSTYSDRIDLSPTRFD